MSFLSFGGLEVSERFHPQARRGVRKTLSEFLYENYQAWVLMCRSFLVRPEKGAGQIPPSLAHVF